VTFTTAHLPAYLRGALASDQGRPRVTYYDDATGERVELSAQTLANWVTKTVNLLADEVGVESGARVSLHLPLHWLAVVWAVAVDAAGAELVVDDVRAPVDIAVVGPDGARGGGPGGVDGQGHAATVFAVSLAPMAMPFGGPGGQTLPSGARDFSAEVRTMPDQIVLPPESVGLLNERGAARAAELGLENRERVGVLEGTAVAESTEVIPLDGYIDWLVAPLCVDGSVVWVRNPKPQECVKRWEAEQVTAVLGPLPSGIEVPPGIRHRG
jgi:uncharacterized protein (TIGR03089 family)